MDTTIMRDKYSTMREESLKTIHEYENFAIIFRVGTAACYALVSMIGCRTPLLGKHSWLGWFAIMLCKRSSTRYDRRPTESLGEKDEIQPKNAVTRSGVRKIIAMASLESSIVSKICSWPRVRTTTSAVLKCVDMLASGVCDRYTLSMSTQKRYYLRHTSRNGICIDICVSMFFFSTLQYP